MDSSKKAENFFLRAISITESVNEKKVDFGSSSKVIKNYTVKLYISPCKFNNA